MKKKNLNGDMLSREQETSALISQCFRNRVSNLMSPNAQVRTAVTY